MLKNFNSRVQLEPILIPILHGTENLELVVGHSIGKYGKEQFLTLFEKAVIKPIDISIKHVYKSKRKTNGKEIELITRSGPNDRKKLRSFEIKDNKFSHETDLEFIKTQARYLWAYQSVKDKLKKNQRNQSLESHIQHSNSENHCN